ncbi:MAG TPA: hypothetical protein VGM74_01860 [Burkholderiaceae bacterium]|jgi:DNA-binding transcriptional regulator YdaS (Cro superfamily)
MQVKTLIEKATNSTGSQAALARALGVTAPKLSNWKAGDLPCPIETQAEMCELARLPEEEAKDHIWRAVLALRRAKKTSRNS